MKKKTFMKKLSLNKVTVTNLENQAMDSVHGGIYTMWKTCWQTCEPRCDTVVTCEYCPVETDQFNTCTPCFP